MIASIKSNRTSYTRIIDPYYEINGSKSPSSKDLVLISGLAGSTRYWNHLVADFIKDGFRIIRIDMLGFGCSPRLDKGTYDIETQSDAVLKILNSHNITQAAIVGYPCISSFSP